MSIQWFPGHMLKARREATERLAKTDVVIEVLDARVPHSSLNAHFESMRQKRQRPALKLLNKADLADPARTDAWLAHYNAQKDVKAVALSAKDTGAIKRIPALAQALAPHRGTALKPLRMMILGAPNVGKSTLMNALVGRRLARVGNEPGITLSQTRHELDRTRVLIDTPGMLWANMAPETGQNLAAAHIIGRAAYDETSVAWVLGGYLFAHYPHLLTLRYGEFGEGFDPAHVLRWIGQARGMLVRGGGVDETKAAQALLNDFRSGALGRITLETPEEVETRLANRPSPPES